MALFVVACGILLMLGGAISLLLGFDIVMTERGAAMTIGGVVALSGGTIALGIGLALIRLNQLVRVLENRSAKPARAGAPDRPVVPLAAEDGRSPSAESATPPSPVRAPPLGDSSNAGTAAGLAGAAAAIGAASGLARTRSDEGEAVRDGLPVDSSRPASLAPSFGSEADVRTGSQDLPEASSASSVSMAEANDRLDTEPREEEARDDAEAPPPSSLALPLDLEEELSRALAETDVPPDPVAPAAVSDAPAEDRSFEDGLSMLLGRPVRPPASPIDPPPLRQDLADMLHPAPPFPTSLASPEGGIELQDLSPPPGGMPADPLVDESAGSTTQEPFEEASPEQPDETHESLQNDDFPGGGSLDEIADPTASPQPLPSPAVVDAGDDDLFEDPSPERPENEFVTEEAGLAGHEPAAVDEAPSVPVSPTAPVLGTYTIGGRTYRMFGDGSVEAVSEGGEVERFSSMDELRKHLARA